MSARNLRSARDNRDFTVPRGIRSAAAVSTSDNDGFRVTPST
jgi:hypothetical protein